MQVSIGRAGIPDIDALKGVMPRKPAGATPMTARRRPLSRMVLPSALSGVPKARRARPSLTTATGTPYGSTSSSGVK